MKQYAAHLIILCIINCDTRKLEEKLMYKYHTRKSIIHDLVFFRLYVKNCANDFATLFIAFILQPIEVGENEYRTNSTRVSAKRKERSEALRLKLTYIDADADRPFHEVVESERFFSI